MEGRAKSQWVIDPKVYIQPTYKTEYIANVAEKAPAIVYGKSAPRDKYFSQFKFHNVDQPFPTTESFQTTHKEKFRDDLTAGKLGYDKRQPFKVKEVQVDVGIGKLQETAPFSHDMNREPDMRLANVRGLRHDGIRPAGRSRAAMTTIPGYNIIPGVGGETVPRFVFDNYEDKVRALCIAIHSTCIVIGIATRI
jgi:hypothetical protein